MKRIIMMLTVAAMMMVALTITAGGAIAAPANPKPPPEESGPGDDAQSPGTCTTVTQKGANVETSETQGSCKNQKVDEDPEPSKSPPGTNK